MVEDSRDAQYDLVKGKIETNIESFRSKRDVNRKQAFYLRMIIVIVGAITTILLGLKPYADFANSDKILSASALVCSAIIPIFAAWEAFFDPRWLWIQYTEMLGTLYGLRDELEYMHAEGRLDKSKLDNLFQRLQKTLDQENREWSRKRNKEAKRKSA